MADEWYYAHEGEEFGPISAARLKQLASTGQLQPTDLVWKTGMDKRVPARTVKGLWGDSAPGVAKPPTPPPPQRKPPPVADDDEITDVVETADDDDEEVRPAKKGSGKAKKGGIPVLVWILGGGFLFLFCCVGCPVGSYFTLDYYGSNPFGPRGKASVENIKKLKKGMSLGEVEAILGPGKVLRTEQGGRVKIVVWDEGMISETIFTFENDKLPFTPGELFK